MLDSSDEAFATQLQRTILKELNGDAETPGLYRQALGCPTWDNYQRMVGTINGFEVVLGMMQNIAKHMNGDQKARNQVDRSLS